jgi:hypothetical protein
MAKKVQEIAKEEKLARYRLKEMHLNAVKRFKEVGSNGVFS